MTVPVFNSRSEWRRAYSRRRNGYLRAGDRYMDEAPHECPAHIRHPYTAKEWVALSAEERREIHRKNAEEFVLSKVGPMPGTPAPAPEKKRLTLSALERLVIEQAENHCNHLRFILNGDAETVEAIVHAQRPAFRARVFDELTSKFLIVEG